MPLNMALTEMRETQDCSLQFDFVCRAGISGSCAMLINSRPALACRDVCPQNLPLATRIAHVRRQMAKQGLAG